MKNAIRYVMRNVLTNKAFRKTFAIEVSLFLIKLDTIIKKKFFELFSNFKEKIIKRLRNFY